MKVRARNLPSKVRTDAGEATLDADRRRKVSELLTLVHEIGAEAERRGLTEEKLGALLDERQSALRR